jgi:UDP-N-acetylglucosamine--N-acetylmuramyl-(pentapeptide) pyrophosphoryl-undecaprenol N-acetylglucosamine transferase
MTIVLTGGGSGGHITPILAVAAELKKRKPGIRLVYIGQKGDSLADIPAKDPNIDKVYTVRAGKFRRYHSEGLKQLLDLPTMYKNIRDGIYVLIGIYQSRKLIKLIKPSIVFSRGGYVSVPVGLGAKLNHVPYITHDSDPIPSLANKIIAPWAKVHFVALPKEIYTSYPPDKTITTGIPISSVFKPVNKDLKAAYRKKIGLKTDKLLFVIGGGLGAQSLNEAVLEIVPNLLAQFKDLTLINIVGRANIEQVKKSYDEALDDDQRERVQLLDFIDNVYEYSGAADLIVSRGGATNIAEFAMQSKACIVVPSSYLTGGHQLKNAEFLEDNSAAVIVKDTDLAADSNRLAKPISRLLQDPAELTKLGKSLSKFARPDATSEIAELILKAIDE